MKKADFRLLSHASLDPRQVELAFNNQHGEEAMNIELTIIAPSARYVKQLSAQDEPVKKQVRILRGDIAAADIDPKMRALGRHIARCRQKGQSVRIPAMSCSDWGHFLRSLELKRALV